MRPQDRIADGLQQGQKLLHRRRSPPRLRQVVPLRRGLEAVIQHRPGGVDQRSPAVGIGPDHVVRVASLGQDRHPEVHRCRVLVADQPPPGHDGHRLAVFTLSQRLLHHFVPAKRRLAAGGVRVQRQHDAARLSLEQPHLPLRQRGPHRRHDVVEPPLVSGDSVHIPLY